MDAILLSLLFLAALGALGVAALRRVAPELTPLESVALGGPLGVVAVSLTLIPLGIIWGIGRPLVLLVGAGCAGLALLIWRGRPPLPALAPALIVRWRGLTGGEATGLGLIAGPRPRPFGPTPLRLWLLTGTLPVLAFALLAVRSIHFWDGALAYDDGWLWAGHPYIWSDWPLHLANVTSFAYGDNFPPDNPHLAGAPWTYHYLTSLTAAALVDLGLDPAEALDLHSLVFSLLCSVAVYAFARRLTGDRAAAVLSGAFLLLGGGFGWMLRLADANASGDFWDSLTDRPWDQAAQEAANFEWPNMFFALLAPQRAFLYGIPLTLLALTLLYLAVKDSTRPPRLYLAAGLVAGLSPLADLGALLALALIAPFVALLFPGPAWRPLGRARWLILPTWRWALFFGAWILVAGPQLYLQQGGERGATSAARLDLGWVAAPDAWGWFWLKNLGWFAPLLVLALLDRRLPPKPAKRFLWGFMPLFVIGNVWAFQPWNWNNTKFLLYWYLAVCILVAALIVTVWRTYLAPVVRVMVGVMVATMLLSGGLMQANSLAGNERFRLFGPEEIEIAAAIRANTPPDAIFAAAPRTNQPVPALAGRKVVLGYPGWLSSYGIDFSERADDLRAIYALAPETPALLSKYGIDYVIIGPLEREYMAADEAAFRERYPITASTERYVVFDVSG